MFYSGGMNFRHEYKMTVRDYECDIQGIVNNSVYQNYLEHARHEFLISTGLCFSEMHEKGIDPVIAKITLEYKQSLRPRDEFTVRTGVRREGRLRFIFDQQIIRAGALILSAEVVCVTTQNGRPVAPDAFMALFD